MTDPTSLFLRDAELFRQPLRRRLMRRLMRMINPEPPSATPLPELNGARVYPDTDEGSGIFGRWTLDAHGLPCYCYQLDQYRDARAAYPNVMRIDRRDHWHQIGNDRITALAANDGTIQVYLADRGGVYLNRFAARDEPASVEAERSLTWQERLLSLARTLLKRISRLVLKLQLWIRRLRTGTRLPEPDARRIPTEEPHPRGVATAEPLRLKAKPPPENPARFAFSGGFAYLNDGEATWATAFRYRPPEAAVERVFGLGYYETTTTYRDIRVVRRVYAPYGDDPFLLADVEIENLRAEPVELRYYEYWDINVYQLKLQWLRGDPFYDAGDEERSAINDLFLPQISMQDNSRALRFHQEPAGLTFPPDDVSDIDFSPADVFLADLTGQPEAYYTDKYAFFGQPSAVEPEAVRLGYGTMPDAPSTDSMPYCATLRRDLRLNPGERTHLRYAYGTVRPGQTFDFLDPFRVRDPLAATREQWRQQVVYFDTGADPALTREMAWHSYYLLSSTVYSAYYGTHLTPQGSAYLYLHGADGAPRDQALFVIPLVYARPDLARDTLRLMMALQHHQTGAIPYSFSGHGYQHGAFIHEMPSDLDLFFLFALNEYLAATGDMAFLDVNIPFYGGRGAQALPPGARGTTVLDHARAALTHLTEAIGKGEHGLIRIGDGDWSDGVVFETATRLGGLLAWHWFENSKAKGESIPNSQMALYVLPLTKALLGGRAPDVAATIDRFLDGLEDAVQAWWNTRWYARAILRDEANTPVILDSEQLNLEAQPWVLISGLARRRGTEDAVVRAVKRRLDDPSPTGAPLLASGAVWPAISQLLTWGYCRSRPALAWRSLLRHTLAAHAIVFPDIWINAWSGPDAVFSRGAPTNPGGTWHSPATPMTDFPVMNNNQHGMALLGLIRVCGIEPSEDGEGLLIEPHVPRTGFVLDLALMRLVVTPTAISGVYRPVADGSRTLHVRVPEQATNIEVEVASQPVAPERTNGGHVAIRLNFTQGQAVPFHVRWAEP